MNLEQLLATVIANFAIMMPIFLWTRGEANADRREIRAEISAIRSEISEFKSDVLELTIAIHKEIADFHARLCVIEERK